jgi:hypothetical protein
MGMTDIQLEFKPDFDRARYYWDAFWRHELIDRPCTVIIAEGPDPQVMAPVLQAVDADFDVMINAYDKYARSHCFLGESIPGFTPNFGPDQFTGFLGAPLKIDPQSPDTSWTEKVVAHWPDFLPLKIDENNPCWKRMHEFHQAAETYCKGKCLLYEIDMHSNFDSLEALRGAENLLFDLADSPEVMERVIDQMRPLYNYVYESFRRYGNKEVLGTNSGMELYSRGKTDFIQSDFICIMNPAMVRRFVLPALEEESQFLDHSCFHLDGPDALVHLDDILSIKEIGAVQWLPGAGARPQHQWPEVLHKIQSAGKAIVVYADCDLVKEIHKDYRPELVVYHVSTDSRRQAEDLLVWLKSNT